MTTSRSAAQGPRVVLIGPPGGGKSTTAKALGHRTGWQVRDTDDDVVEVAGKTITEIFFDDGEPHFRELEREAVTTALATHTGILALGGGAVLDPLTESALAAYTKAGGTVVFLDVSLSAAAPRVGFNRSRPLLLGNPRAQWQQMMTGRRPIYERIATMQILTDDVTTHQVAEQIKEALSAGSERPNPERPNPERPEPERSGPERAATNEN